MDADGPFIVPSDGTVIDRQVVGEGTSKVHAPVSLGGLAEDVDEGEDLRSEEEEEEEEEEDEEGEDAEIDLDEEEDEEDEMAEDEEMQEAHDTGDDTMGSIQGPATAAHDTATAHS